MSEEPSQAETIREKLYRALRAKAVLSERSKQLARQVDDLMKREDQNNHLIVEMMERQRELNFMLHRANSVLHRIQEANAALSAEFTDLVKELPEPQAPDWEQRVAKINELFKRTGALADEAQDEIFRRGIGDDDPPPVTQAPDPEAAPRTEDEISAADSGFPIHQEPAEAQIVSEAAPDAAADEPPEPDYTEEEEQDEASLRERRQELFDRLLADDQNGGASAGDGEILSNRPGLICRMWRRVAGPRDKKGPDGPDGILDTGEVLTASVPEAEIEVEASEETVSVEPEPCESDARPAQAISDLLDETADGFESIDIDIAPGAETASPESPQAPTQQVDTESFEAVEGGSSRQPVESTLSFWAGLKTKIAEERWRRTIIAIERAEARKARRLERAAHRHTGTEAHGHG